MSNNRITEEKIVDKKVYNIGEKYAKGLQPAIDANEKWLQTFAPIKEVILGYNDLEKKFKVASGRKEFLAIKQQEEVLRKKAADAIRAEQAALVAKQKVEQSIIDTEKKGIQLSTQKNRAQQRSTKLTAEERIQLQLVNRKKKQLAIISSSLATAYEKESAILARKTRRYKAIAVEYGVNSTKAKKLKIELDSLRNKLFEVDKQAGNFQKNVGNYPRTFKGAISSVKSLASAAGVLGGAFLAVKVVRDATRTIIDFDRQLIAVRKTTNLSKAETTAFSKEVVNLGLTLKGISIKGLLKSSEIAGQLGIRGSENILKFSKTLEQLKLTSDIAGEEAARNFAKFIEVSSDSVENADRLGSVITELGNNFATTESQILKNTTEIQKGLSIYDASAQSVIGLGAATNALGNEAEASRGALQTTFKILNEGATTGKNLEKILALTGQTAGEFRKEFAENSVETFRKFVKGLSDSDKEGKNLSNTLSELGITEKRATTVVGSLAKNYNTLEDALIRANTEYETNEALTNEAKQASESLASNIDDLSDSWDALVLSVESGDGAISNFFKSTVGFLKDVLDGWTLINKTTDEYNKKLQGDITESTYKEVSDAYKELGDDAENLAIKEADASRDRVDSIKEEIELLKSRNKEIESERSGFSKGFRKTSNILLLGTIGNKPKEIGENNEKIQELTKSLGFYNGVLKASEEAIELVNDKQIDSNKIIEDSIDKTKKATKKRKEIIEGSIDAYKNLISELQKKRDSLSTNSEQYEEYNEKIRITEVRLEGLKEGLKAVNELEIKTIDTELSTPSDNEIKDRIDYEIELNEEKYELLKELGEDFYSFISDLGLGNLDKLKDLSDKEIEILKEAFELQKDLRLELQNEVQDLVFTGAETIFEKRVEDVDREIDLNNERYAALLDNEKLSQEQSDALEAEKERKNIELEKKRKKREKEAFLVKQGLAVAEIGINLAKTISAINLTAQELNAISFGVAGTAFAAANIPLAIGLAAAQTGVVLAQTIPTFKKGTQDAPEGIAIVDEIRPEVHTDKYDNIKSLGSDKGANIRYLEKGDKIYKSHDDYERIMRASILTSVDVNNKKLEGFQAKHVFNMNNDALLDKLDSVEKAISKIKTKIHIQNNNSIGEDLAFQMRLNAL